MEIFKKLLFVLAISLLTLTACKKDEPDSDTASSSDMNLELGDIICKIDGVERKFSQGGSSAMVKSNVNHYDTSYFASPTGKVIQCGRYDASIKMFTIDIFKDLDKIKTPETYTSQPVDFENFVDNDEEYSNAKEIMLSYTSMLDMSMYMSWHQKGRSSITITSKSNDILEGTFKGVLYSETVDITNIDLSSDGRPESYIDSVFVTDGKFKIQLVRESLLENINQ